MGQKISDALVRQLTPPASGSAITRDSETRGFGVRITAAGAKAFILNYRASGIERRMTIGRYPDWSVAAAREEAKALRRRIDRGEDPMAQRHEEREAPTVADLCQRFLEEHVPRKRPGTQKGYRHLISQWIEPELGHKKVGAVTHADICDLHRRITKAGTPLHANRAVAVLSKMFSLAVRPWGLRPDNPARGVERNPENKRETFLSPAEIGRVVSALETYPGRNAANCILLALLTGCRIGEAMHATWGQFDLRQGTWVKPASATKQGKIHRVPLNAPARQLLAGIRPEGADDDDLIFPGRRPGAPLRQVRTCWDHVTKAAGLKAVRVHDLRHSVASLLISGGANLALVAQILGHAQISTTHRYAHLYDAAQREAVERIGRVVAGGDSAEVVPLKRGA